MNEQDPARTRPDSAAQQKLLPVLVLLSAASGCAALIYEVVWFQSLQLVIGASAVSIGVLLATFMGGMCLGSVALAKLVRPQVHPLRVYSVLELGIGLLGVLTLFALPRVGDLYASLVGPGLLSILWRGALCGLCLLPPTFLMGATLPTISRWVENTTGGVSSAGLLYAGNIAGSVVGCFLAGFYLLRVYDSAATTAVAAGINFCIAIAGFLLATSSGQSIAENPAMPPSVGTDPRWIYASIGLSGFCALGAEVVWTRLLSLIIGATVYTFSLIVGVYLMGLGLGSGLGSLLARQAKNPRGLLCACQAMQMATVAWGAWALAKSLPYWPINPFLSKNVWVMFQLDLARCSWVILPATILWGMSFPLALAAAASGQDPGSWVGRVYAANTAGAILGALGSSLWLTTRFGSQATQSLLICVAGLAGIVALFPFSKRLAGVVLARIGPEPPGSKRRNLFAATTILCLAILLAITVPRLPWEVIAYGRYLPTKIDFGTILCVGEGMNASIAVTEMKNGVRNFHVSGKIEASSHPRDMHLQRMLGHLPGLFHPKPRSVLVVGCGAGVTAGSFVLYPDVEQIVICEIEPLIPTVVAEYFAKENYNVMHDRRVKVIYDDARHYILTTTNTFDIITSDPIHPWVKGAATLYTKEYFQLCQRRLNPGGFVTQWVPLYESSEATVKSEVATFFSAFPAGTIWSNDENGEGYDVVLLGQKEGAPIQVDEICERLKRPEYADVAQSLREMGSQSAIGLLATYAGWAPDLREWLENAELNRDGNLRLQYLAGMGLNALEEELIFSELLKYRRFPKELFVGSPERRRALQIIFERPSTAKRK